MQILLANIPLLADIWDIHARLKVATTVDNVSQILFTSTDSDGLINIFNRTVAFNIFAVTVVIEEHAALNFLTLSIAYIISACLTASTANRP